MSYDVQRLVFYQMLKLYNLGKTGLLFCTFGVNILDYGA